jgi:uncharacterized membrane protein YozB (DUF420 family)
VRYDLLPPINALLNASSTVLLVAAFVLIKRHRYHAHAYFVLSALVTSTAFLVCYLIYHAHAKTTPVAQKFPDVPAALRAVYLWVILLPHTLLAIGMLPMIAVSLIVAYRRRWHTHRRFSPWTMWIWLYVSVTGVIIYWMLYHLFPGIQSAAQVASAAT